MESQKAGGFKNDNFYTVVNRHDEDNGEYTVFFGMEAEPGPREIEFLNRKVPSGWYAVFSYHGDMFDIRETFTDDLYRWIMVKEVELNPNGIGMLYIYESDYPQTLDVKILVPVKNPV
jgi:AraC family transcriptional regulator